MAASAKTHANIPELTDSDLLKLGNDIVALPLVPAVWEQITGHKYTRSAGLQAYHQGRLREAMGRAHGRLYFWRSAVEYAAKTAKPRLTEAEKAKRKPRKQKNQVDKNSSDFSL